MKFNNLKRILSVVLTFGMLLAYAPSEVTAEEAATDTTYAQKIVCALGLIDDAVMEEGTKEMKRSEFAEIIYNILNYEKYDTNSGEWSKKFFGDKDENTQLIEQIKEEGVFSDVSADDNYYTAVNYLASCGFVNGYGDGTFRPDEPISTDYAVKLIIDIMGLQSIAKSFPDTYAGYRQVAQSMKLIADGGADTLRRKDAAQLVYNAIIAEYDEENILLDKYLKLEYIRGTMTDNGYVSLDASATEVGRGNVKIGEISLMLSDTTEEVTTFFAREVEAFYGAENSENPYVLACAMLSGKDECTTISGRVVDRYSNGKLTYEKNGSDVSEYFADGATVIYNYEVLPHYDSSTFSSETSTIDLIAPRGTSKIQYVVIQDWESVYVGSAGGGNVFNKIRYSDESSIIDLENYADETLIYKADGTVGSKEDIKVDTVLEVAKSKNFMIVKICNNKVADFTVKNIGENNYGKTYSNGETEYNLYAKMENKATNKPEVKVGKTYTVYLNSFNEIVWASDPTDSGIRFAFMLKLYTEESDSTYGLTLMNDAGGWETLMFAGKVKFSDENGVEKTYKSGSNELVNLVKGYRGIIRYKANGEGKITYFEIPITNKASEVDGKLRVLGDSRDSAVSKDGAVWRSASGNIGTNIIITNDSAKFFAFAPRQDELSRDTYSVKTSPLGDYGTYNLVAYNTKRWSKVAECAYMEAANSGAELKANNHCVGIVKGFKQVFDDEAGVVEAIEIYELPDGDNVAGLNKQISMKDEDVLKEVVNIFDDYGSVQNPTYYNVEKGDVIRYAIDGYGRVEKIQLIWDYNKPNSLGANGRPGGLVGAIDWYDSTANGRWNPYAFQNENKMIYNVKQIAELNFRAFSGYVFKVVDSAVTITTQDLSLFEYDVEEKDPRFVTETYLLKEPKAMAEVVVSDNGDVDVSTLEYAEIRPYDICGSECSKVLVIGTNGGPQKFIVYNEE